MAKLPDLTEFVQMNGDQQDSSQTIIVVDQLIGVYGNLDR